MRHAMKDAARRVAVGLALKAAIGGAAAALAAFGITASALGLDPSLVQNGAASAVGAALGVVLAVKGA